MKKLKLLFAICALMVGGVSVVQAQTDVTSTYLTNADFEETTALTSSYLYGYGKDGSPYGFQTVDGWTSVVQKVTIVIKTTQIQVLLQVFSAMVLLLN